MNDSKQSAAVPSTYTVAGGDTLSHIALRFYGDAACWPHIAAVNRLSNPHLIHPGDVLKLPPIFRSTRDAQ